MRIFISAGEPSGDLHGANLTRALRQLQPDIQCVGFGGGRMEAAGCRLLYPLCRLAVMWFLRALLNAHVFIRLLVQAHYFFRRERPDAVVLIDYPGFHWWLARVAHAQGIPVFYFVPPQLWAWAGWRVRKMQRSVDHVLCTLPFEPPWYAARGVQAHYIGHPYFDELAGQRLDETFLAEQQARPGTVIALLPGSRDQEIKRNLETLLRSAAHVHTTRPDSRFLVACLHPHQRDRVLQALQGRALPVEVHVGRTPEIIQLAHSCIAVSGSVGLELLYRGKPSVVVYRVRAIDLMVCNWFKTCRFISLVNLLADRELFPEFLTTQCEAVAIGQRVLDWLNDPAAYAERCGELRALLDRVIMPGACVRAAEYVLTALQQPRQERHVA